MILRSGAGLAAVIVVLGGMRAVSAEPSRDVATLRACFSMSEPSYTRPNVALLVPSAQSASPDDRARYESNALSTIAMVCRSSGHLLVRPIRAHNFAVDEAFSASAPDNEEANQTLLLEQREQFVHAAVSAVETALRAPASSVPNDLLGAIEIAVHDMSAYPGKRLLVIDYHGWPDKKSLTYRQNPGTTDVARLRRVAGPLELTLDGSDVVVAGVSAEARMDPSDQQYVSLCRVWADFVRDLRGSLVACGRRTPDFLRIGFTSSSLPNLDHLWTRDTVGAAPRSDWERIPGHGS